MKIKDIVMAIPEKELKEYVCDLVMKSRSVRNDILTRFSTANAYTKKQLQQEVASIFKYYAGKENYIVDYKTEEFCDVLGEFIYSKIGSLMENREYESAYEITYSIYSTLRDIDFEEAEEEEVSMLFYQCEEIFKAIYNDSKDVSLQFKIEGLSIDFD